MQLRCNYKIGLILLMVLVLGACSSPTPTPSQNPQFSSPSSSSSSSLLSKNQKQAKLKAGKQTIFRLFPACGFYNISHTDLKQQQVYLVVRRTQRSDIKCFERALTDIGISFSRIGTPDFRSYRIPIRSF